MKKIYAFNESGPVTKSEISSFYELCTNLAGRLTFNYDEELTMIFCFEELENHNVEIEIAKK